MRMLRCILRSRCIQVLLSLCIHVHCTWSNSADSSCFALLGLISAAQYRSMSLHTTTYSYTGTRTKPACLKQLQEQWTLPKAAALILAKARVLNQTCIAASEGAYNYTQICGQQLLFPVHCTCIITQSCETGVSYPTCSRIQHVHISNMFTYPICSHIQHVDISNMFTYPTCSHIQHGSSPEAVG